MFTHKACHDFGMKLSLEFLKLRDSIVSEHCFHEHGHFELIILSILRQLFLHQYDVHNFTQLPIYVYRQVFLNIVLHVKLTIDLQLIVVAEILEVVLDI